MSEELKIQEKAESHTEQYRTYHVRQSLGDRVEIYSRAPGRPGIAGILFDIPGITIVHVSAYQVSVFKAKLYTWDEIEPAVMAALAPFVA